MDHPISDIAFTPAVKAAQEARGSRSAYAKMEQRGGWNDVVTPELAEFIAARDSLYLGTTGADGQPYIQHRGGPKGFLKVLDERTLAITDYVGNAQYISLGNLAENNKAFIFLMDYPNRHRIKIWGTAEFIEDDPALLSRVADPDYKSEAGTSSGFHVKAWDVGRRFGARGGERGLYTGEESWKHLSSSTRGSSKSPAHVKIWMVALLSVNLFVPLFYIKLLEAQVVLAAFFASFALMVALTAYSGFSRLVGLGHILWVPLLYFLWVRLALNPADSFVGLWVRTLIVLNVVSLVIDIIEAGRYLGGDRREILSGL